MACSLGPDFLCTSISHLRAAEDMLSFILLLFIMGTIYYSIKKIVKEGPLVKRLWVIIIGLIPFTLWKLAGAVRRIFLEKTDWLYPILEELGEVMEGISALAILIALVYFYLMIRLKNKK